MVACIAIVHAAFLASSCSRPSEPVRETPPPGIVECVPAPSSTAPDSKTLTELRTSAESSPLFHAARAGGAVVSCEATSQSSLLTLSFRFSGENSFTIGRDPQIEYTSQEVAFAQPLTDDASTILKRGEREAFGADGCGIDWSAARTEPSADGVSSDRVFRGDVCQCQARIRTDKGGRVIGLLLRSTC